MDNWLFYYLYIASCLKIFERATCTNVYYIVWEQRSTREIGNYNLLMCLGAGSRQHCQYTKSPLEKRTPWLSTL